MNVRVLQVLQLTSLVMADGSSFSLGFRISRERTVSISKSLRPSLLVSGLKQQPPNHRFSINTLNICYVLTEVDG